MWLAARQFAGARAALEELSLDLMDEARAIEQELAIPPAPSD
jgi:hypothetical protein